MAFKMKLFIMAAILLLGVTGVAFASGQVPGAVSGGIDTLSDSGVGGTSAASSAYDQDNAADDEYGSDEATEDGDDDNAASDEYGDDDATEQEDHGQARDDDDEAGEINEHHQGNMGRGAEHANEHANVPATTPVPGGNAPAHEADNEDDHSAQGGTANSGTGGASGYSGSGSGSTTTGTAGSHASSTKSHGSDRN